MSTAPDAIQAEGLIKTFHDPERGEVNAVQGLDLICRGGEIMGLLGPNGAGKTTTLRMLATILAPTAGRARVAGFDVVEEPLEVRRRLGYLPGTTGHYPRLTARETLEYFGRLHGLEGPELERQVERVVDAFDLHAFASGRCEALSTGQKQRVSIARATLHDPEVLILDEPANGLDPAGIAWLRGFIATQAQAGKTVLVSSHQLAELENVVDDVIIINKGKLVASGSLHDVTGDQTLEQAFLRLTGGAQ